MLAFYQNTNVITHQTILNDDIANSLNCNGPREVGTIKCEKNYELCEGCGQKIYDRYLMRVADTSWHEHCLSCCLCGVPLNQSCYTRDSKLYCKIDYDRIFGIKCPRCGDRLQSDDMVMRAQHYTYHLACFVCWICGQRLKRGEQFILRGGQLYCRHDFEKDLYLSQQRDCLDDDLIVDDIIAGMHHPDHSHQHHLHHNHHHHRSRDGRRGPKRPRTILTSSQRRQFKGSFEQSPKPCRKVREGLAKETGLSVRVVQVWFQNQRAKMKKIQRKSKQDGNNNNNQNQNQNDKQSLSDKDNNDNCQDDDKFIKLESPTPSGGGNGHHYLNGIGDSYNSSSQPLNPNISYSTDDYQENSNDSFCSSDISYDDGSNFDQLDEATSDTLSLQNVDINSNSNAQQQQQQQIARQTQHEQSQNQSNHNHHHHHHNNNNNHHNNNNNHHHHHNNDSQQGSEHGRIMGGIQLNTSSINGSINHIDKLCLMQNSYF